MILSIDLKSLTVLLNITALHVFKKLKDELIYLHYFSLSVVCEVDLKYGTGSTDLPFFKTSKCR